MKQKSKNQINVKGFIVLGNHSTMNKIQFIIKCNFFVNL